MASPSRTLYVGTTNDLVRRVSEHRDRLFSGFSATYDCTELVYYEWDTRADGAIGAREANQGLAPC
jgi:predicted GIY-YIG superfamily endonuclease